MAKIFSLKYKTIKLKPLPTSTEGIIKTTSMTTTNSIQNSKILFHHSPHHLVIKVKMSSLY